MIQKALSFLCLNTLLLIAAAGCDGNGGTLPDPSPEEENVPLTFAATVPETRAGAITTDNLRSMGVFAYYTGSSEWTANNTPDFMYNQLVERPSNGPWGYTPVKYWPNTQGDKISFFAYAPHSSSNPSLTFEAVNNFKAPKLNYTLPLTTEGQIDLLAATPRVNLTRQPSGGGVVFTMNHLLTRVAIFVQNGDGTAGKQVTNFSLTGNKSGALDLLAPTADNPKGFKWTIAQEMTGFSPKASLLPLVVPDAKNAKTQFAENFFLLPSIGKTHTFSITYTCAGTVGSGQAPVQTVTLADQPLPVTHEWTAGAYVSYTFIVEKQKLTVKSSTHPTWNDAGTGTITGSVVITYTEQGGDSNWGNGGSGTVDGKPVVTHTTVQNDVQWEDGGTEIVTPS